VSTAEQNAASQVDELNAAGCYRVYTDHVSGVLDRRPELDAVLGQLRPGDTLVVWRLDRLGRSLRHLIDTVTALDERQVGFRSLRESIDTTTPGGRLVFHLVGYPFDCHLASAQVPDQHRWLPGVGRRVREWQ
jgi:DNA invertase Pin-like site-specific DNA recombinase